MMCLLPLPCTQGTWMDGWKGYLSDHLMNVTFPQNDLHSKINNRARFLEKKSSHSDWKRHPAGVRCSSGS